MTTPPGPAPDGVTRPLIVGITGYREDAPVVHLCFPGTPARWVEMRLKARERVLKHLRCLAELEVQRLTREAVQLLFEVAHDGPDPRAIGWTVHAGFLRPGAPDPAERELAHRFAALVPIKPHAGVRLLYEAGKMSERAYWNLNAGGSAT